MRTLSKKTPVNKISRSLKWKSSSKCWSLIIVQGQKLWILRSARCSQWPFLTHFSCSLPPSTLQMLIPGEFKALSAGVWWLNVLRPIKQSERSLWRFGRTDSSDATARSRLRAAGVRREAMWPLLPQPRLKGTNFYLGCQGGDHSGVVPYPPD